jgi:hypothetical protein
MPDDDDNVHKIPEDDEVEEVAVKPQLIIQTADLPATARELRGLFIADDGLYERGRVPVEIRRDAGGVLFTQVMKTNNVIVRAHELCQPVQHKRQGPTNVTLPDKVANLWLDHNDYGFRPLAGTTTSPILRADGALVCEAGYDSETQIYVDAPPAVKVKADPNKQDAEAALLKLRETFKTFPFKDAVMVERDDGMKVVDLNHPPGFAESSYLNGLLTAVARASLWLAPGLLIYAPKISGAGSGKGLLARAATIIAYGIEISPFPHGDDAVEFDKRLGAALMTGRPVVFTDNVNGRLVRSETLAMAITERPAEIRVLGYSNMATLTAAFIVLTGNALTTTEDLARRFLLVIIDPQMENPETRPFKPGFLDDIMDRRIELLEACLTILRYGRLHAKELTRGRPLGSFEQWAEWVRDPLLTLGCEDPVEEMLRAKMNDPARQELRTLFITWHEKHKSDPVTVGELHQDVRDIINPQNKPIQWLRRAIERYVGTRIGGYVMTRSKSSEWVAATYALVPAKGGQYRETDPVTPVTPGAFSTQRQNDSESDPVTPVTPPDSTRASLSGNNSEDKAESFQAWVEKAPGVTGVASSFPDGEDGTKYRSYSDMVDAKYASRSIAEAWKDPAYRRKVEAERSRRAAEYEEKEKKQERSRLRRPDK